MEDGAAYTRKQNFQNIRIWRKIIEILFPVYQVMYHFSRIEFLILESVSGGNTILLVFGRKEQPKKIPFDKFFPTAYIFICLRNALIDWNSDNVPRKRRTLEGEL